ncbi:Factor arrest protein 11 [Pleurotus ostreatus]|uniref:Factor arrest protein 11 n=1 Tax=Pleurotus ostreatus TaxID=5322 RepID=A0A8H7DSS8_PLEOS|nr:Factor arrest protein 11 [Pleurotus ostreatus]KAF7433326.1 Factor arrest protein 11 [Pleurotus ostreatus]
MAQLSAFVGSQSQDTGSNVHNSGLDSITLGQLKAMVGSVPKPKKTRYDFRYDDEDMVMSEIDEFYSYVEMPQAGENLRAWEGSFDGEWTKSSLKQRTSYVEVLLESLEHRDPVVRFTNARRLFYVLQGTFAEITSVEHQLHWIIENAKLVRSVNGVSAIVEAMKIASSKYDLLCGIPDTDVDRYHLSVDERSDVMEELTTEIHVYLGLLYHIVEVLKGNDDFADELMSLDPPLPVYLFNVVAGMRDKSAKNYPIKKLLLLLWKSMLACCGGIRELARVKALTRELDGLPSGPMEGKQMPIKSSPMDIESFRHETSVKYPTFTPPQAPASSAKHASNPSSSKLAQAYSPIPIRHHYHTDDAESHNTNQPSNSQNPFHYQQPPHNQYRSNPQPATPAPSPPPSPKPKKQQFHTDPNRPFLFPFSRSQVGRDARLVPFAIEEADRLYNKHLYISLSTLQMWRTREDCMTAESGLDHLPGHEVKPSTTYSADDSDNAEPLPDIAHIDAKILEATKTINEATSHSERQKAREQREDLVRLKRVEQIYSATLTTTSSWVQVIMKLLLATVSASLGTQPPPSTTSAMFPPGVASPAQEQPPPPPQTLEEIDITRHREITSKAVSAILLLTLKWYKVSHVMKHHFLGQHLLEFNCLLILLKMFSIQEVTNTVVHKADSPENNFFQHCLYNFSRNPPSLGAEPVQQTRPSIPRNLGDDVELLTDYSWRNLFTAINFAKIMQKLSKHRSHRIWMLSQHKSSAVLKRITRVAHPMLQLQALKLIKSQVPYCGRKWRTSNMKVITQIYLNCRPELRDEWLTGMEPEDQNEAQAQEQALRHLLKFYNTRRYGSSGASNHSAIHRRTGSVSHGGEGLHSGSDMSSFIRPAGTPNVVDSDVFPPPRSHAPNTSIFLPYITEDIAFEEEYEEYLSDLGWTSEDDSDRALFGGTSAWHRLPAFASEIADGISDSESIASIGDLGDDARLDLSREDRDSVDENVNNWEHMSPKTMAALPKSPAGGRRSSSGGGLRPVLPFGLDDENAVDDDDEPELGPAPRESDGPFASGAGVDEVEYAYGV